MIAREHSWRRCSSLLVLLILVYIAAAATHTHHLSVHASNNGSACNSHKLKIWKQNNQERIKKKRKKKERKKRTARKKEDTFISLVRVKDRKWGKSNSIYIIDGDYKITMLLVKSFKQSVWKHSELIWSMKNNRRKKRLGRQH